MYGLRSKLACLFVQASVHVQARRWLSFFVIKHFCPEFANFQTKLERLLYLAEEACQGQAL